MSEFLFQYEKVNPISWAYLSSLLMIALFFKFNRFWTIEVRAGWSLMTVHPVRTHNDENYRP